MKELKRTCTTIEKMIIAASIVFISGTIIYVLVSFVDIMLSDYSYNDYYMSGNNATSRLYSVLLEIIPIVGGVLTFHFVVYNKVTTLITDDHIDKYVIAHDIAGKRRIPLIQGFSIVLVVAFGFGTLIGMIKGLSATYSEQVLQFFSSFTYLFTAMIVGILWILLLVKIVELQNRIKDKELDKLVK